jgi:hypothetical protein
VGAVRLRLGINEMCNGMLAIAKSCFINNATQHIRVGCKTGLETNYYLSFLSSLSASKNPAPNKRVTRPPIYGINSVIFVVF